ncbi:MAG: O-antigen ligase family protein [Isosphaeraceae bacterium]
MLAGVVALGLFQLAPWPGNTLRFVDPALATLRNELLPATPERVAGETVRPPAVPLAATLSQDPEATWHFVACVAGLWLVLQAVQGLRAEGGAFRRFCVAFSVNAGAVALFSVVQYLSWDGRIYWTRPSPWMSAGPFYNHNHLAAYLNLGLALTFGLIIGARGDRPPGGPRGAWLLAGYNAALLLLGVLVSLSRTGFLSTAALVVAGVLVVRRSNAKLWAALLAVAMVLSLLMFAVRGSDAYTGRLLTITEGRAYVPRLKIWGDVVRSWPSHPWLGAGLGAFPTAVTRFLRHDDGETYLHAENEVVEWLVEGGLAGLGFVAAGCVSLILLQRRGLKRADTRGSTELRGPLIGAGLAGVALAIHSLGDFALHTAALALPAVILAGFVANAAGACETNPSLRRRASWPGRLAACVLVAGLGGFLVIHHDRMARAESCMREAGLTLYDRYEAIASGRARSVDPDAQRDWVEKAIAYRPGWAEGRVRLAEVLIAGYEREAESLLAGAVSDREERAGMATAFWLHERWHEQPPDRRESPSELAAGGPIRRRLVPALRAFLDARDASPYLALPHLGIASLDFLIERGDSPATYLARARRLSGSRRSLLEAVAGLAMVEGDPAAAAECWKTALSGASEDRGRIIDQTGKTLPPDLILSHVVTDAGVALAFAERVYKGPEWRDEREAFGRAALDWLKHDVTLPAAERLALEARAWNAAGDTVQASDRMAAALSIDPEAATRRRALVELLISAGRIEEAHRHARIGAALSPGHPDAAAALDAAAEALAKQTGPGTRTTTQDDTSDATGVPR